jgi:hypothetical protein
MRLQFFRFCSYCIAGLCELYAQPSGTISGIVLNQESNAPIRRALVTLSTVETRPRAHKNGYQGAAFGVETPYRPPVIITLGAGENRSDFVLRLQSMDAISGAVLLRALESRCEKVEVTEGGRASVQVPFIPDRDLERLVEEVDN